jgi:peroxiredoxin
MRNKLNECTSSTLHYSCSNDQQKCVTESQEGLSVIEFKLWTKIFCGVLFFGLGVSQLGYSSHPRFEGMEGLDLIGGNKIQVQYKQAKLGTVVLFLSARCPCSASHQSVLEDLSRKFSSQGFNFIGVHSNSDETFDLTRNYFKGSGLGFTVLQDDGAVIANELKAYKTPHVFVISPQGEILFQGGVDNSHVAKVASKHYLKEALEGIAAGKMPDQKEVRVLGCEIKR